MSANTTAASPEVSTYIRDLADSRLSTERKTMRAATAELPMGIMQISPEQGHLLTMLAKLMNAKRAVEVGVFTGYSALCLAEGLADGGCLVACDLSEEWTDMAKAHWETAGVNERIDLRIGAATETMDAMLAAGDAATYDIGFVDADKEGYGGYVEQVLQLLRPGGVLALDNMLMGGRVLDANTDDPGPRHIIDLTKQLWADERVEPVFIPIGDGLVLLRKC